MSRVARARIARAAITTAALGIALLPLACGGERQDPASAVRPLVAVSVPPQAYFVERIAGDLVRIAILIPPGASPHTYEPSVPDRRAVAEASLYVRVGHPAFSFERAWLDQLLAERRDLTVVDASAGVEVVADDPHVWVSPRIARGIATNVASALAQLLPANVPEIEARRDALLADIEALDQEIRALLAGKSGRRFFVFHPALGYFAAEYDLEQVAMEHEGKEPDAHELATLIREVRASGVKVILVQPQFSAASARVLADEVGGRVAIVDPLQRDWLEGMRATARALAEALGP